MPLPLWFISSQTFQGGLCPSSIAFAISGLIRTSSIQEQIPSDTELGRLPSHASSEAPHLHACWIMSWLSTSKASFSTSLTKARHPKTHCHAVLHLASVLSYPESICSPREGGIQGRSSGSPVIVGFGGRGEIIK